MVDKDRNDENLASENSVSTNEPSHNKKDFNKKYVQFFKEIQKQHTKCDSNSHEPTIKPMLAEENKYSDNARYAKRRTQRERSQKKLAAFYSLKGLWDQEKEEFSSEKNSKPNMNQP